MKTATYKTEIELINTNGRLVLRCDDHPYLIAESATDTQVEAVTRELGQRRTDWEECPGRGCHPLAKALRGVVK